MYDYRSIQTRTRYKFDMSIEEAAELARRAIYHATFRDAASGGVASGTYSLSFSIYLCVPPVFVSFI